MQLVGGRYLDTTSTDRGPPDLIVGGGQLRPGRVNRTLAVLLVVELLVGGVLAGVLSSERRQTEAERAAATVVAASLAAWSTGDTVGVRQLMPKSGSAAQVIGLGQVADWHTGEDLAAWVLAQHLLKFVVEETGPVVVTGKGPPLQAAVPIRSTAEWIDRDRAQKHALADGWCLLALTWTGGRMLILSQLFWYESWTEY